MQYKMMSLKRFLCITLIKISRKDMYFYRIHIHTRSNICTHVINSTHWRLRRTYVDTFCSPCSDKTSFLSRNHYFIVHTVANLNSRHVIREINCYRKTFYVIIYFIIHDIWFVRDTFINNFHRNEIHTLRDFNKQLESDFN